MNQIATSSIHCRRTENHPDGHPVILINMRAQKPVNEEGYTKLFHAEAFMQEPEDWATYIADVVERMGMSMQDAYQVDLPDPAKDRLKSILGAMNPF